MATKKEKEYNIQTAVFRADIVYIKDSLDDFKETYKEGMRDLKVTVKELRDNFQNLEAGRLSAVEKDVANITGRIMYIPLLVTIAINAFFFILNYFIKR